MTNEDLQEALALRTYLVSMISDITSVFNIKPKTIYLGFKQLRLLLLLCSTEDTVTKENTFQGIHIEETRSYDHIGFGIYYEGKQTG